MKIFSRIIFLSLISYLLLYSKVIVQAKLMEEEILESDKVYEYDLDGDGKKEKINYVNKQIDSTNLNYEVIIKINGKNVYQKKGKGFSAIISICNIDTRDKYKELILRDYAGDDDIFSAYIMQYKNKKLKSLVELIKITKDEIWLGAGIRGVSTNGKGILYWGSASINDLYQYCESMDPMGILFLGNLKKVAFTLENGKIQLKKVFSYEAEDKYVTDDIRYYTAKKKIITYEKPNIKSKKSSVLKKGEEFQIDRIKKIGKGIAYLRVVKKNGKKSWIYVSPGVGEILLLKV